MTAPRISVYLRGAGGQVRASFQDCLVRQLGFKEPEGNAFCHLDGDKLVLSVAPLPGCGGVSALLRHPPFCPVLHLSPQEAGELPLQVLERGVQVGVVTLLQTSDTSILLTSA